MTADQPLFMSALSGAPPSRTLALAGELDVAAAAQLAPQLDELVAQGGELIVDLSELTFIDSTGLKAMLVAQRASSAADCRVVYRGAQPSVRRLLEITGTEGFFTFAD